MKVSGHCFFPIMTDFFLTKIVNVVMIGNAV